LWTMSALFEAIEGVAHGKLMVVKLLFSLRIGQTIPWRVVHCILDSLKSIQPAALVLWWLSA
jgi:hypothetical protein